MSDCEFIWVGETLFWMGWGAWGCMEHYFGWVVVSGALFWVGRGGWCIILVEWSWVVMIGDEWE